MTVPFRLMGIVNVTPDSFSDGGRFLHADDAIAQGRALAGDGAAILDIGGESTRPGSRPVGETDELARVVPVIEALAAIDWPHDRPQLSIDTRKASVARAALAAGASLVNDVSALGDREMAGVVAESGADCCLMHMLGEPSTMQDDPRYDDVVDDVKSFLEERMRLAVREGVREERVLLDPGIGFGKRDEHNLELIRRLDEIVALGRPVVIGTSRKGFLGRAAGAAAGSDRLAATLATNVLALERGASVFRVHDVAPAREALAVATATLGGRWTASSRAMTPTSSTTTDVTETTSGPPRRSRSR
jgi:dihydropteroate synthase